MFNHQNMLFICLGMLSFFQNQMGSAGKRKEKDWETLF
jgi:hypothetical protein